MTPSDSAMLAKQTVNEDVETTNYKKMAGTAAVFVFADQHANTPVERDGLTWQGSELHLETLPDELTPKEAVASSLALEGLESYNPPSHGDLRAVAALRAYFVYIAAIKGWVEHVPQAA